MIQLNIQPVLHQFQNCKDFVEEFGIGEKDLVISNEYIFDPAFGELNLGCRLICQEKYGAGEPTDAMVEGIMGEAHKSAFRRVFAIGGGTVIDIAKIIAVSEPGDSMDMLYDKMQHLKKRAELIIVPTTCGTGSEMTNIAIINRIRMGTKKGLVSPAMYADSAALIPELLKGLPFGVFAASSIDALVHAVESSLSPNGTSYTRLFGYKAIEIILRGYQRIVKEGRESLPELLEEFLIASNYAGIAFSVAGCAAVHACSYPLSGTCHVAHGESNYAMFTGVLKNYMEIRQDGEIARLNEYLAKLLVCKTPEVYDRLEELLDHILPKKRLREYGVKKEDLPVFAKNVIEGQGRLLKNNFVPLDYERILKIYTELY